MNGTERAREQFTALAARADVQHFAAMPDWLVQAAEPKIVSERLTRSISAFATGERMLDACKIGGLRLNAATHTWVGTYTLTMTTPATAQRQVLALRGTLFPPGH